MAADKLTRLLRWVFVLAVWITAFTGFGNMPLYKRYYVADVPGLGWLANFYTNVNVHYITGSIVLAIGCYFLVAYVQLRNRGGHVTKTGVIRAVALGLLLITGIVMAVKNLPAVTYPLPMLVVMNLAHLGMAVLYIVLSAGCAIGRCTWTKPPAQ